MHPTDTRESEGRRPSFSEIFPPIRWSAPRPAEAARPAGRSRPAMSLIARLLGPTATGNEPVAAAVRETRRPDADPMGQTAGTATRFLYGADLSLDAVERAMLLGRIERSRAFRRWLGLERADEMQTAPARPAATVAALPERRAAPADERHAA